MSVEWVTEINEPDWRRIRCRWFSIWALSDRLCWKSIAKADEPTASFVIASGIDAACDCSLGPARDDFNDVMSVYEMGYVAV